VTSYTVQLDYETTYYWCVASENSEDHTMGDVWSFTTEEAPLMALTGSAATGVSAAGGSKTSMKGNFAASLGQTFAVHVGPNGDDTDLQCLSGRPGKMLDIVPHAATALEFYLPVLEPGVYSMRFKRQDKQVRGVANKAITVLPKQFGRSSYSMRRTLPPLLYAGPRFSTEEVAPVSGLDLTPTAPTVTGSYAANDLTINGTADYDFATVHVYLDGAEQGEATVLNGVWSLTVRPLVAAETITAKVETVGGLSAASSPVVVT